MGTPFTTLNGNTDITKLIVNQDISKISTKSTRKINMLIHKLEDTISELNEATIAETHMHDDEIEYNQMFIELLKHEINRIFETICKLFNNCVLMYYLHILVYLNICCRLTNKRKK
jgi:hypothetical protein